MFITRALVVASLTAMDASTVAQITPADAASMAASAWPIQVRAEIPCPPTAFPSEGSQHLFYELYLTNFSDSPVALHNVDVIDGDRPDARPLATFAGSGLSRIARVIGSHVDGASDGSIPPGGTLVLFLEVLVPERGPIPARLAHRLSLGDGVVMMAAIPIRHSVLKVLGRPVTGANWIAADGPGSDPDNHHRRGLFVRDGALTDSRRFAIDWKIVKDGKSYRGDDHAAASYFAYGRPLLAIGDALVLRAEDGHPDNPAGHGADFHPAQPVTIDNVGGNHVVLDLGDGQYAHYFHMRAGSVRVRPGERVRKGEVIGMIGSSGDAREPHVHLEITDTVGTLTGEGLPYVIDRYTVTRSNSGAVGARTHELPLDGMLIDFGK
nr:M23 family metallopeptidase [Sphingomonas populi]